MRFPFGVTLGALLLAGSAAAGLERPQLDEARQLFQLGRSDEAGNERAAVAFEKLRTEAPDDPLVLTYLACIEALRGRYALLPWRAIDHARAGIARIDAALAAIRPADETDGAGGVPAAQEARLVAAATLLDLPESFGTFAKGRALIERLLADPARDRYPDDFRATLLLRAAQIKQRDGAAAEARALLTQAQPLAHGPLAAEVRGRMLELP